MKRWIMVWAALFLSSVSVDAFQATIAVPNGTGAQVRTGMNNALQAITTHQSGSTAPTITYPGMLWMDTTSSPNGTLMKFRNSQNTAWITWGTMNDSTASLTFPGSISNATNSSQLEGHPASYFQPASSAINTGNISSQSVNYAVTAGSASSASYATGAGQLSGYYAYMFPFDRYENNLRIVRGTINYQGTILSGAGFTAVRSDVGHYTINFNHSFTGQPIVIATGNNYTAAMGNGVNGVCVITTGYRNGSGAWVYVDDNFSFLAMGPN